MEGGREGKKDRGRDGMDMAHGVFFIFFYASEVTDADRNKDNNNLWSRAGRHALFLQAIHV